MRRTCLPTAVVRAVVAASLGAQPPAKGPPPTAMPRDYKDPATVGR